MKKQHLIILLTFVCCASVYAQFRALPFDWSVQVGGSYFTAPALHNMLKANDAGKISPASINFGVEAGYRVGKVNLGARLVQLHSFTRKDRFYATTPSVFIATNLLYVDRWIIVPHFGMGAQFSTALIRGANIEGSFDDFISTNGNQTRLRHIAPVADLGITLKTYDLLTATYRPRFRIGYQSGLSRPVWKVGAAALANAPQDRIGTFYVQLSFGVGR